MRTNIINQMRAMLKTYGIILKPEFGKSQEETIQRLCEEGHGVLFETLAAVLSVYQALKRQIAVLVGMRATDKDRLRANESLFSRQTVPVRR